MIMRSAIASLGFCLALSGCSFEHVALVDYDNDATVVSAGGQDYAVKGFVHAETWTPAFFYVFPLLPAQNLDKAKQMAAAKARAAGADRIADVHVSVETHMPFLWIAGWIEHHVSAVAVSPPRAR